MQSLCDFVDGRTRRPHRVSTTGRDPPWAGNRRCTCVTNAPLRSQLASPRRDGVAGPAPGSPGVRKPRRHATSRRLTRQAASRPPVRPKKVQPGVGRRRSGVIRNDHGATPDPPRRSVFCDRDRLSPTACPQQPGGRNRISGTSASGASAVSQLRIDRRSTRSTRQAETTDGAADAANDPATAPEKGTPLNLPKGSPHGAGRVADRLIPGRGREDAQRIVATATTRPGVHTRAPRTIRCRREAPKPGEPRPRCTQAGASPGAASDSAQRRAPCTG